jgi:predicted ATPase
MDILAWLRKLGHDRFRPVFRSIEIDGLLRPKAGDLREPSSTFVSQRDVLLSAIAVPEERPVTPKRPPVAPRMGRSPGRLKILDSELEPARSTVATRSSRAPEQHRPTPFVGRETELRRLLDARSRAAAGQGQVVLLSGDAGVGKSRIVRELRARKFPTVLWHRCSPEHALSPLHPVIGLLQQLPGLPGAEGFELDRCDEPVVANADLLGRDDQASGRPCGSTPQRLRSRTFEMLLARIEQLAQQEMVLAVYEDLQWADPSTLEFLDRLVERIADLPVLAIMTFRPEFEAAWRGHAHVMPLALTCLEPGPCEAMIHHLSAGETLAEPVPEHIVECSGGVPLLVEELTKAALAVTEVDQGDRANGTPGLAIPSTLREGLAARLGPASDATSIAQVAAVIGCEFSQELLAAVVGWPQDRLRSALEQLVASELLLRTGSARDEMWVFNHALIRDTAYESIAAPLRRQLHGQVAQILEARWPEPSASMPEVLAQHYAAAGLAEPAVAYWLRAGRRASEGCAQTEAIAMFSRGLDLLDGLSAGLEPVAQRAELLAALAQALIVTKGLASPEVAKACGMAFTLCQSAGEDARLFPAVRSLWEYYNTRADFEAACELAAQCQKLAAHAHEPQLAAEADFCLGVSSLFAGQLAVGRERLNRSVVKFEARGRRAAAARDMPDPRIIALVHLAQALWLCGCPDQALRASQEAVETARAAGHPFALTYALLGASWVSQLRREVEATRALATDAMACATDEDFPAFLAMASILRGWASVDSGTAEPAPTTAIRKALEDYRATGMEMARPYLLGLLAEVHGGLLETEPALDLLDQGANLADATGERWYEPEIRRQEGELLLRQSITNRRVASARLCQAIAVAQQQGGKSLELRAAVSLARLWADVGRRSQARDLLTPIYGWFQEGFETADLKDAKTLLDELQ